LAPLLLGSAPHLRSRTATEHAPWQSLQTRWSIRKLVLSRDTHVTQHREQSQTNNSHPPHAMGEVGEPPGGRGRQAPAGIDHLPHTRQRLLKSPQVALAFGEEVPGQLQQRVGQLLRVQHGARLTVVAGQSHALPQRRHEMRTVSLRFLPQFAERRRAARFQSAALQRSSLVESASSTVSRTRSCSLYGQAAPGSVNGSPSAASR
jgi:hypothetical protein